MQVTQLGNLRAEERGVMIEPLQYMYYFVALTCKKNQLDILFTRTVVTPSNKIVAY